MLSYINAVNNVDLGIIINKEQLKDIKILILLLPLVGLFIYFNPILDYSKVTSKNREKESIRELADINAVALLAHGNLAKRYVRSVNFEKKRQREPSSIIYGNKKFGFFKTRQFKSSSDIEVSLVPFTFKEKINFCVQYADKQVEYIGSRVFSDPRPNLFKNIKTEVEGAFSDNFFLLSAQFVPDEQLNEGRSYLPIIVNKYGELIWGHLPQKGKRAFRKYLTAKQIKNGQYGVLYGEKYSYFEKVNIEGQIIQSISPKELDVPFVVHHDFTYLNSDKLLTLGHKLHYVRNIFPFLNKKLNLFNILEDPVSFLSTPVQFVDLAKKKAYTLWDPISKFNPLSGIPWARSPQQAKKSLEQSGRHFSIWNKPRAQVDWNHANSIEYYPRIGILVSMRNLSKVVLLDEKTFEVLWSLGNSPNDSYQTLNEKHAFYHQHHVQLLDDGRILMMDNHTSPPANKTIGSRVLIYGLNRDTNKAMVTWNYQPKSYLHIGNRGSAYQTNNKNILAFYPASLNFMDHMIEVDSNDGQPKAHMKIFFTDTERKISKKQLQQMKEAGLKPMKKIREGGGNRAVPLSTVGYEEISDVKCEI